ncbi:uncharacterized protein LOC121757664 [Salvia splendens]|uniref:uncharacterized protein LOC121757664 n=1 Tax=Salvia splendens TaxID=180675 RepID=UPI001C261831|nr:uncharacterized protein LOC121757664 [Salvia splendens]
MAPLVRVLRLVDSEKKSTMGYIYEAMEKEKETIMKSFNNNEQRYADIFKIIDDRWNCQLHRPLLAAGHILNLDIFYENKRLEFDREVTNGLYECVERLLPIEEDQDKALDEMVLYTSSKAQWWKKYGHYAPHLQRLAIKIFSLTSSVSGCERNWSVFEQIHSKKRNRLEHQKMHDLVYVKYNQKLCERYSIRDKIDPISLNDIDECNKWLVGELDDPEVVGIGEPTTFTRSKKRKDTSTSSSYVRASKKDTRTAATLGKGKEKLQPVVEEMTLVDESDEEEFEQEFEQEEEEEGYEDDEDDYMALDDEDGDEE